MKSFGIRVDRLNGGKPILSPTKQWWESGVTFNSAAVYLPRSPENDPIISALLPESSIGDRRLSEGVVALHYRARPAKDPGFFWTRSFVGLAVFTPDLQLLKRWTEPVISPGASPEDPDCLGVEDPRITRFGDTFYAVYCGSRLVGEDNTWIGSLCLARSKDLVNWEKLGPAPGEVNFGAAEKPFDNRYFDNMAGVRGSNCQINNKDGVLFPEPVDGRYFMMHRPMNGPISDFSIQLATSDSPAGVWTNCGPVLKALPHPECKESWIGAGSVPIPLGGKRYLVIYHTGSTLVDDRREYDLDAAIFDFERFSPEHPARIVEARMDRLMVPETDFEINGPFPDSVANVLFTCGTYEYNGDVVIVYGGGDSFILAAKVSKAELLAGMERVRQTT